MLPATAVTLTLDVFRNEGPLNVEYWIGGAPRKSDTASTTEKNKHYNI